MKRKRNAPVKPVESIRADLRRAIQRHFPDPSHGPLLAECGPKNYPRRLKAAKCVLALAWSFFRLLPGLRAFVEQYGDEIGTRTLSTISYAPRGKWMERVAEAMIGRLGAPAYRQDEWVAVDSMCNAISHKRHPGCGRINHLVAGVGVLWTFRVAARAGQTAVEILRFADGAAHDSKLIASVKLAADGPIYLMDRGFYCIDLIQRWLSQRVRFVVRVKSAELQYDVVKQYPIPSRPLRTRVDRRRRKTGVLVTFNGVVRLGSSERRGHRPVVRLLVGEPVNGGEHLILASSELNWSATRLLESYAQRWEIEKWHRIVKRALGLAHVYSFQGRGLMLLTRVVLLLALLLLSEADPAGEALPTAERLRLLIAAARRSEGIYHPWAPNTCTKAWRKKRHKKAA